MLGARRLIRLIRPLPFTSSISLNSAFVRLDVRRRKWLLPPLVRTSLPDPVKRNLFEVALWVFSLNLPLLALRGTAIYSFHEKNTAGANVLPRRLDIFRDVLIRFGLSRRLLVLFLLFCAAFGRGQDNQHCAPFHLRSLFYRTYIG